MPNQGSVKVAGVAYIDGHEYVTREETPHPRFAGRGGEGSLSAPSDFDGALSVPWGYLTMGVETDTFMDSIRNPTTGHKNSQFPQFALGTVTGKSQKGED